MTTEEQRCMASGVDPRTLMHPVDARALAALQQMPALDTAIRWVFEHGFERMLRLQNLGSAVRVGKGQFDSLHTVFVGCAERIGVTPIPPLYLQSGGLQAYTSGVEEPFVVLHSGLVSSLSTRELEFVIGHELGHIRCGHVLYNTLAEQLRLLLALVPGAGTLLSTATQVALLEWHRKAELSCDRFGLLACEDEDAAVRVMIKLSGAPFALYDRMSTDAFVAQYLDFERLDTDDLSAVYRVFLEAELSHPWTVERAWHVRQWARGEACAALLRDLPRTGTSVSDAPVRPCDACGHALFHTDHFCVACGNAVPRTCPGCGGTLRGPTRFCGTCARTVGGEA